MPWMSMEEIAREAYLDECVADEMAEDTLRADSLVDQGLIPDPRDYAGLR